ncbi:hypothetical protein GOBAR_AA23401 [Gossypium barbadense]|uniref:Uncharacterized protein n=1 Tax=Gossypium barbadense TaxID=3634 RepID=A0A2P5X1R2_GOSBA|nr:hypothetical protein GOBAR_AA23401 [Gossypium barbadense]
MRQPPSMKGNISNGTNKHKKGLWSPEEDDKLVTYMLTNGQGCWSDVARNAGLQAEVNGDSSLGESEIFGSVDNGIERELYVPPLESIGKNLKIENSVDRNINNGSNIINTSGVRSNKNNNMSINIDSDDVGSFWIGEELKVGEWDMENLMKDVSSFPFLDFQS